MRIAAALCGEPVVGRNNDHEHQTPRFEWRFPPPGGGACCGADWGQCRVGRRTAGKHSIAAGAELFRLAQGDQGNNGQRGTFTFTGEISGNAAADFLLEYKEKFDLPVVYNALVMMLKKSNNGFQVMLKDRLLRPSMVKVATNPRHQ
jgi:hypothetical protein